MTETANDLPILDESQLKRQTMNDPDLEVEILSLFIAEAERLVRQIEEDENQAKRLDRFHAIKGLARNIGAEKLAMIAGSLENGDSGDVEEIRSAVDNVIAYITTADGKVQPL
jgi:HPt (histidine-containing phosphotransfer) domain-containing protein